MKQQSEDQVIPYPKARRFMEEAIRSTHNKPMMHGLLEVDVTKARAYLRDVKAGTGASPSFTAFIACLGRAVDEHRYVYALRKGRKQLILFGDVNVLTWIEREIAGQPQVLPCIVRAANRKTFGEIHDDIRAAQVQDVAKIEVGGAKASQPAWLFRPYYSLATRIGKWFLQEWKKRWGTVTITAVGHGRQGRRVGYPSFFPVHLLDHGRRHRPEAGGRRRADRHARLPEPDVSVDHNMVDGAPAARFTERFKELIESGSGVVDQEASSPLSRSKREPQLVR
jgi:hypothetical protein